MASVLNSRVGSLWGYFPSHRPCVTLQLFGVSQSLDGASLIVSGSTLNYGELERERYGEKVRFFNIRRRGGVE